MSTSNMGSFAHRAAAMDKDIENWDDDADFQGDLFTNSVSTFQTSLSSRLSVRSESNVGDEDWQLLLTPNDENSTLNAITSAKLAGIPIPSNVPSSALLGGSIKRLGKKNTRSKVAADDDWGDDLELPGPSEGGLKLKTVPRPATPPEQVDDDFEDWGEGSLGIRFAGTRRDTRNRSSSVSVMSPSMSSMTFESEDDDFNGILWPSEPMDFNAKLRRLRESELEHAVVETAPLPVPSPYEYPQPPTFPESELRTIPETTTTTTTLIPPTHASADDDFLSGLEITGDIVDMKKRTINRNVQIKSPQKPQAPPLRAATTVTFTDKPTISRIPRPIHTRLDPVYEQGSITSTNVLPLRQTRPAPTTTNAQLLRAKRSAPALRNQYSSSKPPVPFLPAGISSQSHHVSAKGSQSRLRRDSDPRSQSPIARTNSRQASNHISETPSRSGHRKDIASAALSREAVGQRKLQIPTRRRVYGNGTELEVFDDLPTSAAKESQFMKEPKGRGPPKVIKAQQSNSRLPRVDRIQTQTPLPPTTPKSPTRDTRTPRFARDTAASRIAREQRLAGARSRQDGVMPTQTNWKAQVAARSPHNSPSAQRKKGTGRKPQLIQAISAPTIKNEKGMTYNPILHRWEGNESALAPFSNPTITKTMHAGSNLHHGYLRSHPHLPMAHKALAHVTGHAHARSNLLSQPGPPSPARTPALISNFSTPRGVQVEKGMVFDPVRMKWLKLASDRSPPADEEDPFAGVDDLREEDEAFMVGSGTASLPGTRSGRQSAVGVAEENFISEEFDLGPEFIKRQKEEENNWRAKVEKWFGPERDALSAADGDIAWRWAVRELAAAASERLL